MMNKEELIEWIKIECSEDDNFYNELSEELDKIFEKEKIKSYNQALKDVEKKAISLAYQKKGKKLIRININHKKLFENDN